jgi:peptidyl-prolyl cis-trans isomerase A (cyclophilin A)
MLLRTRLLVLLLAATLTASAQKSAPADPRAPDHFKVQFDTSQGPFVIEANRADAPIGVDRLYALVTSGFFEQARFFRVVPGFVVQFGIPANPAASKRFPPMKDDPYLKDHRNWRATLTYARATTPNSRDTQLFINLDDNKELDREQFPPVGTVLSGMRVIYRLFSDYGELPNQDEIHRRGNVYLLKEFPKLDYVVKATVIP